ncbi:hypothetical protein IFO70_21955 [Phormidium tenue FACHB-886]|nr:hypothetical protein [Phormidium tenue FACHB-886]
MIKGYLWLPAFSLMLAGLIACSQSSNPASSNATSQSLTQSPTARITAETTANADLTPLFSHIWRVTDAPSQPASGSIYIFLPNGTLLETSCVETYRIATWTVEKDAPDVLRVVEDGQLAFTATIAELSNTTLRLQQNLVGSNEKQDLTLTAVEEEFVCPDLPK